MSFLDGPSQAGLLDCSEGDMKAEWGGADLLDPGGDPADFDISSFFSQLAAACPHSGAVDPLSVPPGPSAAGEPEPADVSLSALLADPAELQEALLAAPESPAPVTSRGKTFVVVKKQPAAPPTRRRRRRRPSPPPYGLPPPAPLSAYNIFFKEQYLLLKSRWRACNRSRAVPRLAGRWAALTPAERQPYLRRAESQRQEYRARLAQYRRAARRWRGQQAAAHSADGGQSGPPESESEREEVCSDDDPADLYCGLCRLYFSSSHNKEQHLLSRAHVKAMAGEAAAREAGGPGLQGAAADVPAALEAVLLAASRRQQELRFLAEFRTRLAGRQDQLRQQLRTLEARRTAALTAQQSVTSRHRQLTEQVQSLLLVPTLFGVMSQWSRDAQAAASAISERHRQLQA